MKYYQLILVIFWGFAQACHAGTFLTDYTTTKACGWGGVYVGPNKPEEHGGVCLTGLDFNINAVHVTYTENKSVCSQVQPGTNFKGAYVGPNRPDLHGGNCIWIRGENAASTYTLSKNCPLGYVYAGPNRPDLHGGYCLKEPSGTPSTNGGNIYNRDFHLAVTKQDCQFPYTYLKFIDQQTPNGICAFLGSPFSYTNSYDTDPGDCGGIHVGNPIYVNFEGGGNCLYHNQAYDTPSELRTCENSPGYLIGPYFSMSMGGIFAPNGECVKITGSQSYN